MARPPDAEIDGRIREAAIETLEGQALAALGRVLTSSRVGDRAGIDRHTVGRRFAGDDLLMAVCDDLFSLDANGVLQNTDDLIHRWSDEHSLPAPERLRMLFRLNFQAVVGWRSFRLGMVTQAAALATVSASGDEATRRTAETVLARRRHMYDELTELLTPFLVVALRATGRRLQPGMTAEQFAAALNCLNDGLALRHLLQPELVTEDLAVQSMEALAGSLTVGAFHDRRRPDDNGSEQFEAFRRVMQAAARIAKGGAEPSVAGVTDLLRGKADARSFFPSDDELTDSLLRWLVGQDEMWSAAKSRPDVAVIPAVRETLDGVTRLVDQYPGVASRLAGSPFVDELRDFVRDMLVLSWSGTAKVDVDHLASQLVDKALLGAAGVAEWELMLDLLEHRGR